MEIGPVEKNKESALHNCIAQLEKEFMAAKAQVNAVQQTPPKPVCMEAQKPYTGSRTAGPKSAYFECGCLDHFS